MILYGCVMDPGQKHAGMTIASSSYSAFILLFDNRTRVLYNTVRLRNLPSSF